MGPVAKWGFWLCGTGSLVILMNRRALGRVSFLPGGRGPGAGLVARGKLTSPFGMRRGRMHWGIDIAAPRGTEVRAALPGMVVDVSPNGRRTRYGNVVIIEHPDGILTFYAHLDRFPPGLVPGLAVNAGTVIGYVGGTQLPKTRSLTPHLHFEVLKRKVLHKGRVVVNPTMPERYEPQEWLRQRGVRLVD